MYVSHPGLKGRLLIGTRSSESAGRLHPSNSFSSPLATSSPSDIADPSPISTSSNGTDTTNIDDTAIENEDDLPTPEPPKPAKPGLEVCIRMEQGDRTGFD